MKKRVITTKIDVAILEGFRKKLKSEYRMIGPVIEQLMLLYTKGNIKI